MIPSKELASIKTTPYTEEAVDLFLSYLNTMMNVVQAAKYVDDCYTIHGEEYYDEDTPESTYVLSALRDLGYHIDKEALADASGEVGYSTVVSWE